MLKPKPDWKDRFYLSQAEWEPLKGDSLGKFPKSQGSHPHQTSLPLCLFLL